MASSRKALGGWSRGERVSGMSSMRMTLPGPKVDKAALVELHQIFHKK